VRYKQAVIGVAWAVLQPLLTMVVFTVVFNMALGIKSPASDVPYRSSASRAFCPGTSSPGAVTFRGEPRRQRQPAHQSLLSAPRHPVSAVSRAVDLGSRSSFCSDSWPPTASPDLHIVFLPVFVALAFVAALAVSLWLSALNVLYRDVQYVIPFLVQLWMFVSPVIYPISKIHARPLRAALALNPIRASSAAFAGLLGQQFPRAICGSRWRSSDAPRDGPLLLQAHGAGVRRCGVVDE